MSKISLIFLVIIFLCSCSKQPIESKYYGSNKIISKTCVGSVCQLKIDNSRSCYMGVRQSRFQVNCSLYDEVKKGEE